jgi:transcriptional regulator with XRE-family HTH domain
MCPEDCTMTTQEDDEDRPARRLGRKLREARISAGYRSQEQFSTVLNIDRTAISRIEGGNRHINTDLLRKWCEACHADFELYEASARLAWVAGASPVPVWFEDFFRAQVLAHTIRTWHTSFIPGLLQTPDFTRALIEGAGTPDDLIEERVATRIDLQQRTIDRQPVPVHLIAVMDEAALHRQVGSAEVRYRQLMHLVEQGQRKHIRIQIVPASRGANAGNVGAFTIASLDDADVMLMGAVEDVTTDKRTTMREGLSIFDRVRWAALSGPESLELIMKVAESCKP